MTQTARGIDFLKGLMTMDFMDFSKTFSSGEKALQTQSQNHRDKTIIRLFQGQSYSCFASIAKKIGQNNAQ